MRPAHSLEEDSSHGADLIHRPAGRDVALIDLVDRLLGGGIVLGGDIVLAAADIDLVRIDLRALISSVPVGGSGAPQ